MATLRARSSGAENADFVRVVVVSIGVLGAAVVIFGVWVFVSMAPRPANNVDWQRAEEVAESLPIAGGHELVRQFRREGSNPALNVTWTHPAPDSACAELERLDADWQVASGRFSDEAFSEGCVLDGQVQSTTVQLVDGQCSPPDESGRWCLTLHLFP